MFEREDWEQFRSLEGLCIKAGVSRNKIAAVVAKELVDNALDESDFCEVGLLADNVGFYVEDRGHGIDPDIIADLFSIRRPQRSTKFLRLPTRGALGNGLRVVASAVLCTEGRLIVMTKGQVMHLIPQEDGTTKKVVIDDNFDGAGTRVEVCLGQDVGTINERTLRWARDAIRFAGGQHYNGKTSAYWYSSRDFYELCNSANGMTVRKLLAYHFEGGDNSAITKGFKGKQASELSLDKAKDLLYLVRDASKPIKHSRLGKCNTPDLEEYLGQNYVKLEGTFTSELNGEVAEIPYILEVWTKLLEEENTDSIKILVNRTPITGEVAATHYKTKLNLSGCNLSNEGYVHPIEVGRKSIDVVLSIITPYAPKTSEGKNPDLQPFRSAITNAITKAVKKTKRTAPKEDGKRSQKSLVLEHLNEAIKHVSGDNQYRYNQRTLFYNVREILAKLGVGRFNYKNFTDIITDYESEIGHDLAGMIRDDRGSVYHPHEQKTISLGSRMAENYIPPDWTFNKALFIEKEGFFLILQDEKWSERHDCALLTSKGQATRAARDLIDGFKDSKEGIKIYCIHDADASGTMIYQALDQATRARPARNVRIINLGLEPWEGLEIGLTPEPVTYEKRQSVADYVYAKSPMWVMWLQKNRIELNAMTTPQFLDWLDTKMDGTTKLIPPQDILDAELRGKVRKNLKEQISNRILMELGIDAIVESRFGLVAPNIDQIRESLYPYISAELKKEPTKSWKDVVNTIAVAFCQDDAANT